MRPWHLARVRARARARVRVRLRVRVRVRRLHTAALDAREVRAIYPLSARQLLR